MDLIVPSNASNSQFYLLAVARGINANSLAATSLSWQVGANAGNSISMIARVFRTSGTMSLMVASLRLNTTAIQPITALSSALLGAASDPLVYTLDTNTSAAIMPAAGNWDVNVTVINGSAATIDVEIWGFKIA